MALWGWGAGNHGQLLSSFDDHASPIELNAPRPLDLLLGGGYHTVIVRSNPIP